MLRPLTSVSLRISRLRCNVSANPYRELPPLSCPTSHPLLQLPAMSTVAESATATAKSNKRAADSKQSGKWKKRQVWRDRDRFDKRQQPTSTDTSNDSNGTASASTEAGGEKRLPKRKVAVVFGYNGSGYAGLQIQTGSEKRTIEAEVADAILKAGGMLASNRDQLSKLSWQRCARTDKGVSASTNVLSMNLITQPEGLLERINSHLPSAIRCFAWLRVMGSFHAKFSCTSRVYHYILPAYAFDSTINQHIDTQLARERGAREEARRQKTYATLDEQRINNNPSTQQPVAASSSQAGSEQRRKGGNSDSEQSEAEDETAEDDMDSDRDAIVISDELRAQLLAYRIPDELYNRVQSLLGRYVGTRNYYNFTRHKLIRNREDTPAFQRKHNTANTTATDTPHSQPQPPVTDTPIGPVLPVNRDFHAGRNNRHILSFTIDRTFIDPHTQLQFLVLAVHGQSFMLNQIRKMVGLTVVAARGMVGEWVWSRVFNERGMYVPTAPALGLYLDRPQFTHYDSKCTEQESGGGVKVGREGEDGERPAVQQVYDEHEVEIAEFRQSVIYPSICSSEVEQLAFYRWLAGIGLHSSLSEHDNAHDQPSKASFSAESGSDSVPLATSSSNEPIVSSADQQSTAAHEVR